MHGGATRIPEGRGIDIPQGKITAFPLGGACSSQERLLLQNPGISQHIKANGCSPMSLLCIPLQTPHATPVCATLPSLGPKVSGCEHQTCALAPLRIKDEKEKNK